MLMAAIDILGSLPKTERSHQYILVIGNISPSGWKLYTLPNQEVSTAANTLVQVFICRYGIPSKSHTDQDRQELCRLQEINKNRKNPL